MLTGLLICLFQATAAAVQSDAANLIASVPGDFGGHFILRGTLSHQTGNMWQNAGDDDHLADGTAELRLKYETAMPGDTGLTIHYENVMTGGDSRRQQSALPDNFSNLEKLSLFTNNIPEDDRRLFDLTSRLEQKDNRLWYHRLDRLYLSWNTDTFDCRVGRQAVTWGNGMLFNPMDLFNPFSPTDVERDYKIGDDMFSLEATGAFGNLHMLAVPRRDPVDQRISTDHSSAAIKYHATVYGLEWDAMLGIHCRDVVAGAGITGYLGGAAWRMDTILTVPDKDADLWTSWEKRKNYVAMVANADLSWFWFGKNWYGLIECHYNSLMSTDYGKNIAVPYITQRLGRGDLNTLGRLYAAGTVQLEAHPLVNLYLTLLTNLEDPSGVMQPRLLYDPTANCRITIGASLYWGSTGSEFGGWKLPDPVPDTSADPAVEVAPNDRIYAWLAWYF